MFLKEFPILPANSEGNFDKFWTEIPRKLYKTLEVLSRSEIPNSKYSMGDLEGLMKSLILRQSQPGQFIVVGGSWTLIGVDDGAPSDVRVELVFFPTYMVVSLMTLFWYRYPERAKRLKGFREALHEGLNFTSMRRLFGHGMEGGEQRIQALNILKMGDVFRYVVEHVDEHPKCRDLYNVLIDCKLDIDKQYYRVSQEIRSLHKSLSILPNKVLWKTSEHFIWRAQYSETTDCLVIVEAPYTAPPKAEIHTDTIVNNLALSLNVACIVGRYSKKYYRHTTFRNRADDFMVREYRRALKEILNDAGALDESEKAVKKVLHLVIRGLADRHGVDVEISTRNNRSCRENISNWVLKTFKRALNMETGPWKRFTAQKDQLFSGGSPYLEVNRKGEAGDETFAGFGENYNTMEIRIRKSTRKTYLELIIDAMGELIENYRNSWSYKE